MKIQYLSDLHLESQAYSLTLNPQADVLVLAGDITTPKTLTQFDRLLSQTNGLPTFYLTGNHEYYGAMSIDIADKQLAEIIAKYKNVKRIEDTWFVHKGVCFAGGTLWTDFNLPFWHGDRYWEDQSAAIHAAVWGVSDFQTIPGMSANKMITFHEATKSFIRLAKAQGRPTVICTHFLPSERSVSKKYKKDILNPYFASDCESLMGDNVLAWIHGHSHASCDYEVYGTRVVANPRGYTKVENPLFNSLAIIEINP